QRAVRVVLALDDESGDAHGGQAVFDRPFAERGVEPRSAPAQEGVVHVGAVVPLEPLPQVVVPIGLDGGPDAREREVFAEEGGGSGRGGGGRGGGGGEGGAGPPPPPGSPGPGGHISGRSTRRRCGRRGRPGGRRRRRAPPGGRRALRGAGSVGPRAEDCGPSL